jgi:hypothetical protein
MTDARPTPFPNDPEAQAGYDALTKTESEFNPLHGLAAMGILLGVFFLGYMLGGWSMNIDNKREAVKAGKAEYVPDEVGAPVWRWKP